MPWGDGLGKGGRGGIDSSDMVDQRPRLGHLQRLLLLSLAGLVLPAAMAALLVVAGGPATAAAGTVTYTYDTAGRLTGADYGGGQRIDYTYDAAGNLVRREVAGGDTTPPTVTCSATPSILWPPNHTLVRVSATVRVADAGSGPAGFTLVSVASNEPDNGLGDGDQPNDIQGFVVGTADTSGFLRAERSGKGQGRVYTLTYKGSDVAGNSATCRTSVTVPHNR